jgi:ribosomal protein S24E
MTFEIFQVRTNNCMSITDLKRKIASKYETTLDNIIISYADKEFKGK